MTLNILRSSFNVRFLIIVQFVLIGWLICPLQLRGQSIQKANDYHRGGYYATAIPIYEAALKKKPDKFVKSKLADCYFKLNQTVKASKLFSELVADSAARPADIFKYGEVLMTMGLYDSARLIFNRLLAAEPNNERGQNMLMALDNITKIQPLLLNVSIRPFPQNSGSDEHAPTFFRNGLVFAGDRDRKANILKEKNKTTGREYYDVWFSEKINDSTYAKPVTFSKKLSNLNQNTGNATFTATGSEVFFCRNNDVPSRGGLYKMQLYSAESKDGGVTWQNVEKLPFCSPEINYMYPSVSADGKHIFFVMDKGENSGGLDIHVAHRTKKGWSRSENLGVTINTKAHECFPFIAPNGKLYFSSKGHIGYGGYDLFVTEQDTLTGDWKTPRNLGMPINSAYDDISITFKDSISGAFSSSRSGESGDDIYFFTLIKNDSLETDLEHLIAAKNFVFYDNKTINATASDNANDVNALLGDDDVIETNSQKYLDSLATVLSHLKPKEKTSFILQGIEYDTTTAFEVSPSIAVEVEKLAALLSQYRNTAVEIGVHTEGAGNGLDLKEISKKRAEAIATFLIQEKGITPSRVKSKGYAASRLLKDCKKVPCAEGEDLINRRVEITVTGIAPQ